jgi:hypothetical protein
MYLEQRGRMYLEQRGRMYLEQRARMYLEQRGRMYLEQRGRMYLEKRERLYLEQLERMYLEQLERMYLEQNVLPNNILQLSKWVPIDERRPSPQNCTHCTSLISRNAMSGVIHQRLKKDAANSNTVGHVSTPSHFLGRVT